ncbi:hypothetical protein MF271_22545 (plasmid) [Deinococcus sp. KNUC1210]|uniref:hypothetical protein n=1 Tax=Deinococcus sp. KNUC1210 TaxID=2917691 RepID=UPI001EF13A52|nr:hypothetical protein [Deinococcus sp. KNUC1210]ULH18248.1 hypothetical protein MF271_22545 [Deinococcus sp. KNUC1210]
MQPTDVPFDHHDFVVIGYMIIEGYTFPNPSRPELAGVVFTPTSCVCTLHPQPDTVPWVHAAKERNEQYRQRLGMNPDDFRTLQEATEAVLNADEWGFDAVFVHHLTATHFLEQFFLDRTETRLVELSVRSVDLPAFLEATAPVTGPSSAVFATRGMHLAALLSLSAAVESQELGFETIGVNAFSDTHTSVCYGVRDGFERAGITFNAGGYLTTVSQAVQGAQMNDDAEGGAVGDASWFAVRLAELARSRFPAYS